MYRRLARMSLITTMALAAWIMAAISQPIPSVQALPPRPTSVATPAGGYIELTAPSAPAGAWTVVQWQDASGNWRDVEGWQGTLESDGTKRWWVAPDDLGNGPFRWVVYHSLGGRVWTMSEPFHLPSVTRQTVRVSIR